MFAAAGFAAIAAALFPFEANGADGQSYGGDVSVSRGKQLALERCAVCHAIGAEGLSPNPAAPIWREFVATEDIEAFALAFEEGRLVHHDGVRQMPDFIMSPEEIGNLIDYIKTLRIE